MTTPANPDDLITRLRAQLDTDEATTRELLYWAQQTILTLQDPKLLGKHIPGWHDWPKVERMCRVRLAELDAKRRILDEMESWRHDTCQDGWYSCSQATEANGYDIDVACADDDRAGKPCDCAAGWRRQSIAARMALPYAARDGYREERRP